ncbi:MAG: aminotransferase class III-fold pyridoxal phosphate-dependent enzyme [Flavobacteriales bacterium]
MPIHSQEIESQRGLETILKEGKITTFIFEPLVQNTAGMIMYPPESLDTIIEYYKAYGLFTIIDEVMTNFGNTSKLFASDHTVQNLISFVFTKCVG